MSEHNNQQTPPLHPEYQPAESDHLVVVHFIGNTPRVHRIQFHGQISPEHLAAAAAQLGVRAEFHISQQLIADEYRKAQQGIKVAGQPKHGDTIRPDQMSGL